MEWGRLLSTKRLGMENWQATSGKEDRTQFQRDYDRIVFSSPFRRLQNKTQVFPLPEHIFVHNRLTHSLEVASVGRSLGNLLSEQLGNEGLFGEIGTIVSTACLAHDLGNPPFGHSGEAAISSFFTRGAGQEFKSRLTDGEWNDFVHFDGNANALRLLTHQFNGKRPGGFALTYTTLASVVKYPFESVLATKQKMGFFQSEKAIYSEIAETLGISGDNKEAESFVRHPLVYLVEAADDICYQVMDVEDAFRLGILSYENTKELYLSFYDPQTEGHRLDKIQKTLSRVSDKNEQVSYLRAGVIGKLIYECLRIYLAHTDQIIAGSYAGSLIGAMEGQMKDAMDTVKEVSFGEVYSHRSVVEIELAGYKIIGTLLEEFVDAIMHPADMYSKKILSILPNQYKPQSDTLYERIQSVVDFVSGMTDVFALDLYRKIKGINLPGLK